MPRSPISPARPVQAATRRQARRGRTPSGKPNPIDVHVGSRVRLRRSLMGMSQENLGNALGLTFQQVQKYERGANRIGSSRLFDLARILDVPVNFFFDEMPEEIKAATPSAMATATTDPELPGQDDPMLKRETMELVRHYYRIADPDLRRSVYSLAKSLADSTSRI